jgi:hypothetical protein
MYGKENMSGKEKKKKGKERELINKIQCKLGKSRADVMRIIGEIS